MPPTGVAAVCLIETNTPTECCPGPSNGRMSRVVEVSTEGVRIAVSRDRVRAASERVLKAEKVADALVNITFVTNRRMAELNRRHLGHTGATDVISFPLDSDLLGELVISAEYAVSEAAKRKIPVEEELLRYVAHGILHLLGYDDHRPADRERMWARQERELRKILGRRTS